MPWIANYSFFDIFKGLHLLVPGRTILIRICDRYGNLYDQDVARLKDFKSIFNFGFDDTDEGPNAMSEWQANEIVKILKNALDERISVVVHCTAGICRSGAVTEVGVLMGFSDGETHRIPNLHVKKLLMRHAGLVNSWDEQLEQTRVQELTKEHYFIETGDTL